MKQLIRFDWAVKRLLRNKANFGILEGFLSELLQQDIRIDSILESEGNQQTGDNKYNKVDMLVRNTAGELIIIEVQSTRVQDYLMRMLFGTSTLVVDNMDAGMGYDKVKKLISVNIVYFDLGQGEDYIYHGTTNFVGMNRHDTLRLSQQLEQIYSTPQIAKIYPEYYIIKVNQFNEVAKSGLDEWIYFLKNEEIKDSFKARGLKEAKVRLDIMKLDETERRDYDRYIENWRYQESLTVSNFKAGEVKGRTEGKLEGKLEGKAEMVINCLRKGMTVSEVAELAGMSEADIIHISNSM